MKFMKIVVYGKPKGWDRSGQNGKFHFDTKKNTEMKAVIRLAAQEEAKDNGISLPIPAGDYGYSVYIVSSFIPAKSTTKKKLAAIRDGYLRPKCKPDADNICKLWLDALVSGGIIEDDKNVVRLHIVKIYGEREFMACEISWVDPEGQDG